MSEAGHGSHYSVQNYAHLHVDELPAFLRTLDAIDASPLVKGAIWLTLWSANRPGVTRTLRWSELDHDLDLEHALWPFMQ